jgi:Cu(I)/Ag(I) efflux system membrane fusion protein
MYIMPSLELFTIADLASVWVHVDVFEQDIAQIYTGQTAKIRVPALPGTILEGQVDYIYPELNRKTRTLKVRLRFDNPRHLLKPNLFVQAELYSNAKTQVLTVPQEALIVTGERESLILAQGQGQFKPIDVTIGARGHGVVEILSGLKVGDQVVTSGQFLIDSESNLQASFQRFRSP